MEIIVDKISKDKKHQFWNNKIYQCQRLNIPHTLYKNKAEYLKNKHKHTNDYIIMTEYDYNPVMVREYIKHDSSVGIGLIIFDDGIFITEPWKQVIQNNKFIGSYYPHELDIDTINKIKTEAYRIAKVMSITGYRGAAGIDFLLNGKDVYFCEVNARKQVSTVGASKVMEAEYSISFYELENMGSLPELKKSGEYNNSWKITLVKNKFYFEEYK